jgi:hypothetical protein
MFDLKHFAVRYRLGLQDAVSLVRAADALLADGHAEPSVVKLFILDSPTMEEAAPLFERACAELGVSVPTRHEAINDLLRGYLESIESGALRPRDGLNAVMREVYYPYIVGEPCKKYAGDSNGIEHLIGAYWSYDDLIEHPREISFAGKYGTEAIICWEESVRQHSRDWLRKYGCDIRSNGAI